MPKKSVASPKAENPIQRETLGRHVSVALVPLLVVALFVAYRTGNLIHNPFEDGDLFWQRQLGIYVLSHHAIPQLLGNDVFSAPGAPWVAQEWLFSSVVAVAFAHDALWSLAVFSGVCVFAAFAVLIVRAIQLGALPSRVALIAAFACMCLSPTLAIRAQVWAWPLFACSFLVLGLETRAIWLIVPIVIVWANLHASVMIVVPIVWLSTIVAALAAFKAQRDDPHRGTWLSSSVLRTRVILSVLVPIATLATPLGMRLPLYAIELMYSPIRAYIHEWLPIQRGLPTLYLVVGFVPLIACIAWGLLRGVWQRRPFEVVVAALLGVLSLFAARNAALFALASMVPASLASSTLGARSTLLLREQWMRLAAGTGALLFIVFFGWIGTRVPTPGVHWPGPFGTVKVLESQPGDHRLFCAEYSWCSVALGDPNVSIFLDGRADPYPVHVWAEEAYITHAGPNWQQLVAKYNMNAVIAWRGGFFESQMQTLPGWREVVATNDACCVLFLKK